MTHSGQDRREKSQPDKFKEAARELETDESEENFDRVVRKVAKKSPPKEDKSNGRKTGE